MVWGSEDCDISQRQEFCTPRPERLPEGEAQGQSRGPRGAKFLHEGNLKVEEVCVGFCGCGVSDVCGWCDRHGYGVCG